MLFGIPWPVIVLLVGVAFFAICGYLSHRSEKRSIVHHACTHIGEIDRTLSDGTELVKRVEFESWSLAEPERKITVLYLLEDRIGQHHHRWMLPNGSIEYLHWADDVYDSLLKKQAASQRAHELDEREYAEMIGTTTIPTIKLNPEADKIVDTLVAEAKPKKKKRPVKRTVPNGGKNISG